MVDNITFSITKLASYKLTGVTVTDTELGRGSFATVLELEYMGLKCAGKKIHEALVSCKTTNYTVRRYEEECRLLSQVRHPNIVQFLGLHVQNEEQLPILVMELIPTTLASCIESYKILPNEISYSILHDVALGLCYLHGQNPPIIHRDLSSNNVLLTPNMSAKISDLGVARILDISPAQVSHMTQTPGTPAFMPPEVMVANPQYNMGVDQFSYGIMIIHIFSGKWPYPEVGPTRLENGNLIPVSEAERRKALLETVGSDHPLMDLILKCINNDPEERVPASQITNRLAKMVSEIPLFFKDKIEMQAYIKASEEDKRALREIKSELADIITHKEEEIRNLKDNTTKWLESANNKKERMKMVHALQVKDIQSQVEHLKANLKAMELEKKAILTENAVLKTKLDRQLERQGRSDKHMSMSLDNTLQRVKEEFQASLSEERERSQQLLSEEKEKRETERLKLESSLQKGLDANTELQIRTAQVAFENETLKNINLKLEEWVAMKDAKIHRHIKEINTRETFLQQKDEHISKLSEQLTTARKVLAASKQVSSVYPHPVTTLAPPSFPITTSLAYIYLCMQLFIQNSHAIILLSQQTMQVNIAWEMCAELPFATAAGQSLVVGDKVYFGGGVTNDDNKRYLVYCYSPTQDQWMTLPPLPVKWFGLGQLNGKLTAVGGAKKDGRKRNDVYTLDSQKWKCTMAPMSIARTFPAVTDLNNKALVVAGGNMDRGGSTDAVEVYQLETTQWQLATSLPIACCSLSLATLGDRLYALGGYDQPSKLNQVLFTSVSNILQEDPKTATWTALQPSPCYQPTAAVISSNLIAVGGWKESQGDVTSGKIYIYSTSTDAWIYVSDLPHSCAWGACALLSSTDIMVVGGRNQEKLRTVHKGTLTLGV